MRQSVNSRRPASQANGNGQSGLALATALTILIVLTILGSAAYRNVGTDISHSGMNTRRIRAEFAAESAIQWGLVELSRPRKGKLPFTLATHDRDGLTRLHGREAMEAAIGPWPLRTSDFTGFPGSEIGLDDDGWVVMRGTSADKTISGGKDERLSFKAWYPNDSTMRMTGRALVDGSQAQLELEAHLGKSAAPI
jgi:hypothetical protein